MVWVGRDNKGTYPKIPRRDSKKRRSSHGLKYLATQSESSNLSGSVYVNVLQAKGKTVMYLPAEMMEVGEVSVAAKDKVCSSSGESCGRTI